MRESDKQRAWQQSRIAETLGEKLSAFGQDKRMRFQSRTDLAFRNDKLLERIRSQYRRGFFPRHEPIKSRKGVKKLNDYYDLWPRAFSLSQEIPSAGRREEDDVEIDQGFDLPLRTSAQFSKWLNMKIPSVRIHQGEFSDKFLRERQADAMTVRSDIFFRSGKFDLKSVRGLGLLGHELTHAAQQQPNKWRNSFSNYNTEQVERTALDNERRVIKKTNYEQVKIAPMATNLPLADSPASIPTGSDPGTPMYAGVSRNIGELSDSQSGTFDEMGLSENEMTKIKNEVYRDLMMRIKVEFERGA